MNEREQPLVPCGFPGFLASRVLSVWNPSQRKAATYPVAPWSVAPAMAGSAFPVLSGAGELAFVRCLDAAKSGWSIVASRRSAGCAGSGRSRYRHGTPRFGPPGVSMFTL